MTRQHVTVALTGDGGDELFAGYPRYQTVHELGRFDALPGWLRRGVAGRWWDMLPSGSREGSLIRRLQFRMKILREPIGRRYVHWVAGFLDERRRELYDGPLLDQFERRASSWFVAEAMERSGRRPPGRRAMLTDLQTYLPCDLLTKVDITSMAHGLECRCPLLDQELVELAITVPYPLMRSGRGPKPLLTSTLPELYPPQLRRRAKMGFRIPLDDWFRGRWRSLAGDVLLSRRALERGYFREVQLRALLEQHGSGRWNHGDRIWALLFLEFWHRMQIDPAAPPGGPPAPAAFGLEAAGEER
jgi:asparagine synthase (glutamine-hydrolysing)